MVVRTDVPGMHAAEIVAEAHEQLLGVRDGQLSLGLGDDLR
jgi:hypothetical protein